MPVSNLLIKPRFYLSEYITIPTKFFLFLAWKNKRRKMRKKIKMRGKIDETVNYILTEYPQLLQKEYKQICFDW